MFVFLLVFSAFALPVAERHRLLTYGIVARARPARGVHRRRRRGPGGVGWLSFVFAAFLIWTGWRMFRHRHDHDGEQARVERLRRGRLRAGAAAC